ncbi:aromatic-ring-hydroxylating dioxygenase subunit beta [Reyranella sp. CPCC 100927]|uniref:aromatic-ring-hydroxylating dioxygenase subunit beta n=1 Tax=Reyranella sp. CPCC 100927 TaxID=2599616 RepID=UPI0011B3A884|nr:aromatic-ring-hydroxylating dioxygenase subunit beta [Reyranella sp. CPCC 100927]TWT15219.1 aromatic-ring-hydroxylating dioxygenase subunit beta [Reyranella sp. CPCC 100927]
MNVADVPEPLRREIEAFLYLEARLADESRYAEWEALVTDDMHYWVPKGAADYDPADRLSYINDNRARLATRIRQLATGLRHAQTPPSPMRRIVSNIEVLAADDIAGTYTVASNFVLYELAVQSGATLRIWPGRVTHRLRRVDGALRMSQKIVELVTASVAQPNLAFLI